MVFALLYTSVAPAQPRLLDGRMHHLRDGGPREWSTFAEVPDSKNIELAFDAERNPDDYTLRLRQQDVKLAWVVLVNGKELGRLRRDENDMVVYFAVAAGTLVDGPNTLTIRQQQPGAGAPDDVRVGQILLDPRPPRDVLSEATLRVQVTDAQSGEHLPSRITVTDGDGALRTVGATSDDRLAVRPGMVYTADGKARFGLPAGQYTIYAGRGFEYSLGSAKVTLAPGQTVQKTISIRREVPTEGYVACDTHIHTLTHSGHGDATAAERMITLAAEGIELPVATEHNQHVDYAADAQKLGLRRYFTPVIGNEVTTRLGHFNVFPVQPGAEVPDHTLESWDAIFDEIYRTPGVKAVVLNHARDLHGGTRPFGAKLHNAVVGENLEGWRLRATAMEVINSSATQTDPLQLIRDWMAMLNRGRMLTPVGSSDSHDVARHFVGQGRTYIRCDDRDPGNIDVDQAVSSFLQGRVMVSYGLLTELTVDGKYGPGELAPVPDPEVHVAVRVLGPHWVTATKVRLYANGKQIRDQHLSAGTAASTGTGIKWEGQWTLARPKHDIHLVAVAVGPGIDGPYWKTAKPYQPTSPDWQAQIIGCSGAVWLDADGDGRRTSAYDYARRAYTASGGDLAKLVSTLSPYDQAVAAQAAHQYQSHGGSLTDAPAQSALQHATAETRAGFGAYLDAWNQNRRARGGR